MIDRLARIDVPGDNAGMKAFNASPDDARSRTLGAYVGSKGGAGVFQRIAGLFPAHSMYVDAFLGHSAVLRHKTPALRSIGIDADAAVIERWRSVEWPGLDLVHGCGIAWLRDAAAWLPADALVYCDPPYVLSARGHRRYYRCELSDQEHSTLLTVLEALPCSVFLSGYMTPLYARRLAGWDHEEFNAQTRGGVRREHLWYRRSTLAVLGGETRWAGRDFRERERIKRKAGRWASRYSAMAAEERAAVLSACLRVERELASSTPTMPPGKPESAPLDGTLDHLLVRGVG